MEGSRGDNELPARILISAATEVGVARSPIAVITQMKLQALLNSFICREWGAPRSPYGKREGRSPGAGETRERGGSPDGGSSRAQAHLFPPGQGSRPVTRGKGGRGWRARHVRRTWQGPALP